MAKLKEHRFLLEELTKRDFKKKYKRTALGMLWSVLSPVLTLLVMRLVFTSFFGQTMQYYTTYLFAGNLIFQYFNQATTSSMSALDSNATIFSKINMPKYMFVLSSNISSFINFMLTIVVFFLFAAFDGITFSFRFIILLYPIICIFVFNVGVGLLLSALYLFFKDLKYLYSIFTMLLMYLSAIFYTVESFPINVQRLFLINPIYVYIKYFRIIVIEGNIPSLAFNLMPIGWALGAFAIGAYIYKKFNWRFIYYV